MKKGYKEINLEIKNGELLGILNTDDISDGAHTFGDLYFHRMILFSLFINAHAALSWKSKKHEDDSMFSDYFIVGITTPQGDYSYHYELKYWDYFKVKELDHAPKYDGHKPEDIDRLFSVRKWINE